MIIIAGLVALGLAGSHWQLGHFTQADAAAFPLIGPADITNGDTIKIAGRRIRLVGIDAPELHQTCKDAGGRNYDCGVVSAAQMRAHIASNALSCQPEGKDRYSRILAVCFIGSEDVNAWLVTEGLAVAYRRYRLAYVSQEEAAQAAHRGLWAGLSSCRGIGGRYIRSRVTN